MTVRSYKKHKCTLNIGSDSMLPKDGGSGFCHKLRKLTLVAVTHPRSKQYFISYPAIVAERQRQIMEGGAWVIHPYSIFSLIWRTFMMFINMVYFIAAPMSFSYKLPNIDPAHIFIDYLLISLQGFCVLDIFFNFNMGYQDKNETHVVMVRRRIVLRYLCRWFIVDILTCIPSAFIVPYVDVSLKTRMFMMILPCLRCTKFCKTMQDFLTFVKIFRMKFVWRQCCRQAVLFVISIHWCSCLLYIAPVVHYYWTGEELSNYASFLKGTPYSGLFSTPWLVRYKRAVFISCSAFFGTSASSFRAENADEMMTNALVVIYGQSYIIYSLAVLVNIYVTHFNTTLNYRELLNQVETYMKQKQFPAQMKARVRDFYRYRYQERYFRENLALDCLSEQLRNEIFLDTCHQLIEKVSLFEGLPANVVGTVLGCLHPEVYLPNDLVIRAGDIGDCMYFIACGTVSVYSLKGSEAIASRYNRDGWYDSRVDVPVPNQLRRNFDFYLLLRNILLTFVTGVCHLDDGAHFGEVALLMKDRKRVATVVAIEITRVYRLDQQDFRDFIMTYQELFERMEALASKRMHETVLIDEAHKKSNA